MKYIILCLLFSGVQLSGQEYYGGNNGQKLDWLIYYIAENYVDSTDNDQLTDLAIRRIVEELDPYSNYQSKEEAEAQLNKDNGVAPKGSGFNFYMLNRNKPIITYIFPEGPAQKAGLENGDQLVSIDSQALIDKSFSEIKNLIDNSPKDEIEIAVFDKNKKHKVLTLIKDNVPYISVESHYMLRPNIGYMKITRFNSKTLQEFKVKIEALQKKGLQSLVLDLRGNLGGVKDMGIALADEFLPSGKLINYSAGKGIGKEEHIATALGHFEKGKVVVLADHNTASASEIFLGALQDWDRCLTLGTPSYGKGLIQQSYKLGDGSTIRLTVGKFYSPLGRNFQRPPNDKWFDNYKDKIPANGLTSQLTVEPEYRFETHGKRSLLKGQGGIYPDVYYVAPPKDMLSFERYNKGGYIFGFATYHTDQNRLAYLERFKSSTDFRNDPNIDRELAKAFKAYIAFNGFEEGKDDSFGTPKSVIDKVKAWMAGQLWNDSAYYELTNATDPTLDKAVELINGSSFDDLGIGY